MRERKRTLETEIEGGAEVVATKEEEMEDEGRTKRQIHRKLFRQSGGRWVEKREMARAREEEDEKEVTICIIQTH